jgi:hypothetical protein
VQWRWLSRITPYISKGMTRFGSGNLLVTLYDNTFEANWIIVEEAQGKQTLAK